MCHSLGPLARGLLFIQLAFYSNTSTPHPQCSGIRPNFGRDTKVQLKTPFSHLEHPMARGQGKGMRVEAKQVISPNKPSKSATRRAQELRTILSEARGRKLRHRGKSRAGGREPGSLRSWGRIGSGTGVGSCPESAGPSPRVPRSIWGCRPLVAATSAASRAVPRRARAAPCPRAEGPEPLRAASTRLRPPR